MYALAHGLFEHAELDMQHGTRLTKEKPEALQGNGMGEMLSAVPNTTTLQTGSGTYPTIVRARSNKSVYHALCTKTQNWMKHVRVSEFVAMFRFPGRMFPDAEHVNHRDWDGNTALHYAAAMASPLGMKGLVEAGAGPHICSLSETTEESSLYIFWVPAKKTLVEIARKAFLRRSLRQPCSLRRRSWIRRRGPQFVSEMLDEDESISEQGNTP